MCIDRPTSSPADTDPGVWVDTHGDALFRYAMIRVRSEELAEELVQETFLAALAARQKFSGQSSPKTWLIGILKHKIVDHIRRASRERAAGAGESALTGTEDLFDEKGKWRHTPDPWPEGDPSRILEQREFWQVFEQCMSKLPEPLADTFRLRELEAMGGEEVCQALEITPTNLWARLHRARLSLRQCLESNWFRRKT